MTWSQAAQHLAPFKCLMVVVFVDALPKNRSGRLLERASRQWLHGRRAQAREQTSHAAH